MDGCSDEDQPTDANQPGDDSILALARIEPAFEKASQARNGFVDKPTVRQWPDLLSQQDGKQGNQLILKSCWATRCRLGSSRRPSSQMGTMS